MRICFFGAGIYDSLIGHPPGGAELQVSLLAKALARNGHGVYILENSKCSEHVDIEKIRILFTASSNLKILRFLTERIPNMIRFLKIVKPDYIYVRGISHWSLIPLIFTYFIKRTKFILAIPSEIDTLPFIKRFKYVFNAKISFLSWLKNDFPSSMAYCLLLRYSDFILCQHDGQLNQLNKYRDKTFVLVNIYDDTFKRKVISLNKRYFIYIGSLNNRKGISSLINLIMELPFIKFRIIGQAQGRESINKLKEIAHLPNVIIDGHLSKIEVHDALIEAKALLNVSRYEGFPNTFLEAWASGIPVISLHVDPGGIIEKNNLGFFASGSIELMKNTIAQFNQLMPGENYYQYVMRNHSISSVAECFDKIISTKN